MEVVSVKVSRAGTPEMDVSHVKPCMGSATTQGAEMVTGADTGKPSLSTPSCLRA